jgi:hypothetical protein
MPSEIVICPVCDHIKEEFVTRPGDKFAWKCRNCNSIIENGKLFLLETLLENDSYYRACPSWCGFGYDYERRAHYYMNRYRESMYEEH